MKIFDTHTHLNVEEFDGREAEELQLSKEMSVVAHNIVGFDRPTIERALELADNYDQLYATIGWHPTEAGTYDEGWKPICWTSFVTPRWWLWVRLGWTITG